MIIDQYYMWRRKKYGYHDENGVPLKTIRGGCPFKIYVCEDIMIVIYENGVIELLDDMGDLLTVCEK